MAFGGIFCFSLAIVALQVATDVSLISSHYIHFHFCSEGNRGEFPSSLPMKSLKGHRDSEPTSNIRDLKICILPYA